MAVEEVVAQRANHADVIDTAMRKEAAVFNGRDRRHQVFG